MMKFIIVAALIGIVVADVADKTAQVRSLSNQVNEDGTYAYQYDISNGIYAQESGIGGQYANGVHRHFSPDGQQFQVTYTADENGYHPEGAHLPTAPPVPAHVLRALEYIRTHPTIEQAEQAEQARRANFFNQPRFRGFQNKF